jgi:hypothetical protein
MRRLWSKMGFREAKDEVLGGWSANLPLPDDEGKRKLTTRQLESRFA